MEGKTKEQPEQTPGDPLAQDTGYHADDLQDIIGRQQADLVDLNAALAKLEKDYAETPLTHCLARFLRMSCRRGRRRAPGGPCVVELHRYLGDYFRRTADCSEPRP